MIKTYNDKTIIPITVLANVNYNISYNEQNEKKVLQFTDFEVSLQLEKVAEIFGKPVS